MSDIKLTLEDVRHAFKVVYSEFYSERDSLLMFDSWVDEFTDELHLKAYDLGFKNGVKCAEGSMRHRS